jgi:hypothetical protein
VIASRLAAVRERVLAAAARAGRSPAEVTLVAVSKTFPAETVSAGFAAGLRHFGENRVQEAETKIPPLEPFRERGLVFHLVGHLQRNKARKAIGLFDRIDAIDSVELGERLARVAAEMDRSPVRALVQTDLAREERKHGVPEHDLFDVLDRLRGLDALRLEGLMLLPPYLEEPEKVRPYFSRLRELRDRAVERGLLEAGELSMGMSHDFEVAIEEGATQVRLGTAVFGQRPPRSVREGG